MKTWSTDARFQGLMAAVRDGDEDAAAIALDWLDDNDVTLTEVLLWYAWPMYWLREKPEDDEAARHLLWRWCQRHEPDSHKDGVRAGMLYGYPFVQPGPRWRYIRDRVSDTLFSDPSRQRRSDKRAILQLFPEVSAELTFYDRNVFWKPLTSDVLNAQGMVLDTYAEGLEIKLAGRLFVSHPGNPIKYGRTEDGQEYFVTTTLSAPHWILEQEEQTVGVFHRGAQYEVRAGERIEVGQLVAFDRATGFVVPVQQREQAAGVAVQSASGGQSIRVQVLL